MVGYFTKKWNERVTIIKAGIGLAKKLLGMEKKEKTEEEKAGRNEFRFCW